MQGTGGDTPLTDLCTICHANPIKYTCPRCGIHTCSLPCVQRHKTWAQCSGIRNPAAYRPRTELASASSIDQDFNFISSIERSLSKADDLVLDRGIDLTPSGLKGRSQDVKSKFDQEVEERRICIIKAPQGLSRSKQNTSHWAGQHKCIMWTIEWLCYDGEKRLQNIPGSKTIAEAFVSLWGRRAINRKKRKRSISETASAPTINSVTPAKKRDLTGEAQPFPPKEENNQGNTLDDAANAQAQKPSHGSQERFSDNAETSQAIDLTTLVQDLHFYLHRPNTPSNFKCLIPISPLSSIQDTLRDKTLLEFPTIHIRDESPDHLSKPYIAEEKYNEMHGSEIPIELPKFVSKDTSALEGSNDLGGVDENQVLEVLQKDLVG
ncbi:uncharacterized protein A1O9_09722 [Exophiala aquamarina CBS 119918]|uniref:Box C/D snoRNA protein 1 n=1 Tax=Exophiala aquamarina CBS 119918 TaxID=1182545 RepID=A0A072P2K0_9EURO|nr:uncharacterized protein A1O9_09722 [Exophiala aquamarina CBS 119918]KEF53927.1 hypothetical protein A1O9_09722 [Exophiala aquamarina CBS 119918]